MHQDGIKCEFVEKNGSNKFKVSRFTRMPRNHFELNEPQKVELSGAEQEAI